MAPRSWRQFLESAESPEHAQIQLTYALLDEIRSIKTMLGWALFGIPGAILVVWLIIARS
jgi:hypothetical protein